MPAHSHTKHQILYTFSGTLQLQTEGKQYFVPEGHIAWIPAAMSHRLDTKNEQISLLIFYFYLGKSKLADADQQFQIFYTENMVLETLRFIAGQNRTVIEKQDTSLYNFTVSFFTLLPSICKEISLPLKGLIVPQDGRLQEIMKYIALHCHLDLKLTAVADRFGFTERNLSRLFKKDNLAFSSFLNQQRIIKAMEFLAEGDIPFRR